MSLLIKNGEIITASDGYVADIFCEGETITAIGRNLPTPTGAEVIDAPGKYVFPGFIDPHVHIYLPFMGTFAKGHLRHRQPRRPRRRHHHPHRNVSAPAAPTSPSQPSTSGTRRPHGKSACDFTFHMGVAAIRRHRRAQLREIVKRGIASFKIFLAYKGAFGIDDTRALPARCDSPRSSGVIVTAHCENAELVAETQRKLIGEGKTGTEWHEKSRPARVEAEGVHHLLHVRRNARRRTSTSSTRCE